MSLRDATAPFFVFGADMEHKFSQRLVEILLENFQEDWMQVVFRYENGSGFVKITSPLCIFMHRFQCDLRRSVARVHFVAYIMKLYREQRVEECLENCR